MRRSHKVAKTDAVLGTETFSCEIRRCALPWLTTENTNEAHLPGAQRPTGSSRLFVSHGSSDRGRSRTSRAAGNRWSRTRRCARPSPGTQRGDIPGQVLDDAAAHYPDARVERHGAGLGSLQRPDLSGIGVHPTDLRHGGLSVRRLGIPGRPVEPRYRLLFPTVGCVVASGAGQEALWDLPHAVEKSQYGFGRLLRQSLQLRTPDLHRLSGQCGHGD